MFAGHRIEGLAGRGGMGVVYKATHIALDHVVALKVISPALAQDERFRRRFGEESRIAVSIRHPNVVAIHHAGEEEGLLFVTMDLIDGTDLRGLLHVHGQLDPAHAASVITEVAAALDAAHARGLVHRDIKPGNILIEGEGADERVYLTDFGLARLVEATTGVTATGAFVGTLDYVAPEQIRGERVDARADVYALGCVLFELLTGNPPFAARDDKVAKMYAHLQEDAPRPSMLRPELPARARPGRRAGARQGPRAALSLGRRLRPRGHRRGQRPADGRGRAQRRGRRRRPGAAGGDDERRARARRDGRGRSRRRAGRPPRCRRRRRRPRPPVARQRSRGRGPWLALAAGAVAVAVVAVLLLGGGEDERPATTKGSNPDPAKTRAAGESDDARRGRSARSVPVGKLPVNLAHGQEGCGSRTAGESVSFVDGDPAEGDRPSSRRLKPEGVAVGAGSIWVRSSARRRFCGSTRRAPSRSGSRSGRRRATWSSPRGGLGR